MKKIIATTALIVALVAPSIASGDQAKGLTVLLNSGDAPSAKEHLKILIKKGATVQVCPLYLPNSGKNISVLLDGITVAKPPAIAGKLLDKEYQNISF